MKTRRLTMGQAIVEYLKQQYVERDGIEQSFFAGMFGIFGHGNVAGIGQALHQYACSFRYYQTRNEQAMVHTAAAFAKMNNRMRTLACTTSIGPGATNMLTAAAGATINRLPVLLLPGDIFANRLVSPVLQQLESQTSQDLSVNDCFKPISKYWDRINRPEQIITSLPEAMRVLTSQAETGTVTLSLPQDVQSEAYDYPVSLFEKRTHVIARSQADAGLLKKAVQWIQSSRKPLIISGGGTIYADATTELRSLVEKTWIPVAETFAGKGSLNYNHPQCLGAMGVTGTPGANIIARDADLVIVIGSRLSDFTTASKTAFQNPNVRFININVAEFDAAKHAALPLVGDARTTLSFLVEALNGFQIDTDYAQEIENHNKFWLDEVNRIYDLGHSPQPSQGEVIGAVNRFSDDKDVVVCAAGSMPGDLHKLWQTNDPKGFHLEYGYSCMGYEIAGGLGCKMASPDREIYVLVGDGSYLMMAQEIVTSIQEGYKLTIILINNNGYASINGLSNSVGVQGYGTKYRYRGNESGQLDGQNLPVDLAKNAESLGANVIPAESLDDFRLALEKAKLSDITTVVSINIEFEPRVPGYESWWDVPVAEVSEVKTAQAAYREYEDQKVKERYFLT
ncbi:3D-(3,5/4)-trihydroxycyclohexane-1,2-dione acylhydrolase (decyclizing) [Candidatus Poribacteria bacterium]|nr:3D-(3,5/4)-trihydroxycyclohexane-1,2-dione acylhydrolase (decyclizing) [Candidatus Poribacteria bacterium]OUT55788.1 MAG: 3D-(3,5/4)-trihydroxycyclohexane-1,2-dione acylhydrolase (decyclizing) [bacterium TMED15]